MNLESLLSNSSRIAVLGHQNADPDAISSMIAVARLYCSINPTGSFVLACNDISRVSHQMLETFGVQDEVVSTLDGEFDLYVIVDTNSRFQLGLELETLVNEPAKTLIIDHHERPSDVDDFAEHILIENEMTSTCEIMVNLFTELDIKIDPLLANLLLTGMLYDTRRFFYVGNHTLPIAVELVQAGADYRECVNSLISRLDRSERIARLKAAGRLRIHQIGDWIIVTSKVGAFEASACRAILDIGADVSIVGARPAKGTVRLSSRSTRRFYTETGVNLGTDVMSPLGNLIGGEGGGHANAAGANGVKNRGAALTRAIELIRDAITHKK